MKTILLFAHGARNPEWARPIHAIRDAMRALQLQQPVEGQRAWACECECAFLEFIDPLLDAAIDQQVAAGCTEIVVVPIFMASTGHTQRELPVLLEAARARHPGLSLRVAAPIGEVDSVIAAIAQYALSA